MAAFGAAATAVRTAGLGRFRNGGMEWSRDGLLLLQIGPMCWFGVGSRSTNCSVRAVEGSGPLRRWSGLCLPLLATRSCRSLSSLGARPDDGFAPNGRAAPLLTPPRFPHARMPRLPRARAASRRRLPGNGPRRFRGGGGDRDRRDLRQDRGQRLRE